MENDKKLLCVGGSRDGKMIACEGRILLVPVSPIKDLSVIGANVSGAVSYRKDTYELERVAFQDGHSLSYWRHQDLSAAASFARLLSHYQPSLPPLASDRVAVMQDGECIGTVPVDFSPHRIKVNSLMFDLRPTDFVRHGDFWVAHPSLGPGDLELVPGLVLERKP